MKKWFKSLVLFFPVFILFATTLQGQADEFIGVVDLSGASSIELVQNNVHVFFCDDDFALVLADQNVFENVQALGIKVEVAAEYDPSVEYYLIKSRNPQDKTVINGQIFRISGDWLLYGGTLDQALWLQDQGHGLIFLNPEEAISGPGTEVLEAVDKLTPGQIGMIEEMVDKVSQAQIQGVVEELVTATSNRTCFRKEGKIAGENIFAAFESLGFDSLYTQPVLMGMSSPNVVAVIPGTVHPDIVYVIGGHYDSITMTMINKIAPGADDNASGTATVMEAARVLKQYSFENTLIFVTFSGEEIGLFGSAVFARMAKLKGMDLRGVVNIDMDGFFKSGTTMDLDVVTNDASYDLYEAVVKIAEYFVPELPVVESHGISGGSSDHASFWSKGYKAVWFFEDSDDYSPYIHTTMDKIGLSFNCPELAWRSTQIAVATVAALAVPVEN